MINITPSQQITKIYLVTNCHGDPNKVYIGKTKNCRKSTHKRTYGQEITYDYIDEINSLNNEDWEPLETFWIEYFRQFGFEIMNIRKKGGNGPEFHSEETKTKLRKPKSKEHRLNISLGKTGKLKSEETKLKMRQPRSEETKINMSIAKKGNTLYEEHKNNLRKPKSEKAKLNMKKSEETKEKLRIPKSEELKLKLSKPRSEEAKLNMRKPKSEEAKINISIGHYKPILQYSKNGILIQEWSSIKEASDKLKLNNTAISRCCRGEIKTSGGSMWEFKNNKNNGKRNTTQEGI